MLGIIVFTIFISLVSNIILKKFHLPTIIGYIFTGTIVAYTLDLHSAVNNHELKEIAEFGVVFLMFTIGLEFSIAHLKKMKYEVFVTGTLQIVITSIIGYIISYYILGLSQNSSFVVAIAISLSSTAIVLKTFNESGDINKRFGQRTLGILIMQDIAVIPILLLLGFLSSHDGNISSILINTFLNGFLLLGLLYLAGKYLLEPFFIAITKTNSDELFVSSILFMAIGASYLAYQLGFSYSLGAFIAGMLISETKFKHQAEADLIPFRDLLLGIFFITVGMQINFATVFNYIHIILIALIAIMALKFIVIFVIVKIHEDKKTSFKTAISLVQIGEFSLAILEISRTNGLISAIDSQILIVTIIVSMILTPIILKNLSQITDKIIKKNDEESELRNYYGEELENHVVLLGYGEFGKNIANALREQGDRYIIVENNITAYYRGVKDNQPIIFGNALKKEILKNTSLDSAKFVIIAIDNPKKLYQACEIIQKIVENEKIIIKVHSEYEKSMLADLNIDNIIIENVVTSRAVANFVINQSLNSL